MRLPPADPPSAKECSVEIIVVSGLGVIALLAIKFLDYCR
jgi:hypothetical protein